MVGENCWRPAWVEVRFHHPRNNTEKITTSKTNKEDTKISDIKTMHVTNVTLVTGILQTRH